MKIATVNISFHQNFLKALDNLAHEEARSRSELIREATRMYMEQKKKWKSIFNFGTKLAKKRKLKEKDVDPAIQEYRQSKS